MRAAAIEKGEIDPDDEDHDGPYGGLNGRQSMVPMGHMVSDRDATGSFSINKANSAMNLIPYGRLTQALEGGFHGMDRLGVGNYGFGPSFGGAAALLQ